MNKRQKKKYNKKNTPSYLLLKEYLGESRYKNIFLGAKKDTDHKVLLGSSIRLTLEDMRGRVFKIYEKTSFFNLIIILTDSFFSFNDAHIRYFLTNPIPYNGYDGNAFRIYSPYTYEGELTPYTGEESHE